MSKRIKTIYALLFVALVLHPHFVDHIGPIARPEEIIFSHDLPKTRSGKIMRRLLKDIADGKILGDMTTLADPEVINELKKRYEEDLGVSFACSSLKSC